MSVYLASVGLKAEVIRVLENQRFLIASSRLSTPLQIQQRHLKAVKYANLAIISTMHTSSLLFLTPSLELAKNEKVILNMMFS